MPDETKASDAKGPRKNAYSVALHAYQQKRAAWKKGGKDGPEPKRPERPK